MALDAETKNAMPNAAPAAGARSDGFGLGDLFASPRGDFEDGDMLFVAHRQKLRGKGFEKSISWNVFNTFWVPGNWRLNALVYTASMVLERVALWLNNSLVVALLGRNAFFPNKPRAFHAACAAHARLSLAVQGGIILAARHVGTAAPFEAGVAALVYLLLAEVAWQLPTHPACAMFMTNHESRAVGGGGPGGEPEGCQPTSSVYLGPWYDALCLCSNYHVEHHDFPDVPLTKLPELRRRAPEFYGLAPNPGVDQGGESCLSAAEGGPPASYFAALDWGATVRSTFESPGFYACTGAGAQIRGLGVPLSRREQGSAEA